MDNRTIILRVREGLNKLSSSDYDNIENWQIVLAFNVELSNWVRRQLHGSNIKQTGDEQSKRRIDDLEVLLTKIPLTLSRKTGGYEESTNPLPSDYMEYKRVEVLAENSCCEGSRLMTVWLAEEANVPLYLKDSNKKPSFSWACTFCTFAGGKLRIYTNGEFEISEANIHYYRQPRRIEIAGVENPFTGVVSPLDVDCEFKEDVIELIIEASIARLAANIDNFNQYRVANNNVENNN